MEIHILIAKVFVLLVKILDDHLRSILVLPFLEEEVFRTLYLALVLLLLKNGSHDLAVKQV